MNKFDAGRSLGSRPPNDIALYLAEIGDATSAAAFTSGAVSGQGLLGSKRAYTHTGTILGYVPETKGVSETLLPISGASKIERDDGLANSRIKILLDKFYVYDFPGNGTHTFLCEFAGKNQVAGETEELRFALRSSANDRSSAGINGHPIFLGVTVGADGISFEGRTVNVCSTMDEAVLTTLESPAFKTGLSLLHSAQPALKPFSSLAEAVVRTVVNRKKNVQVHSFNLGLDFANSAGSARLRHGSYIVVQNDDVTGWDWNNYEWNRDTQMIQFKQEPTKEFTFNFMVFSVSPFTGDGLI